MEQGSHDHIVHTYQKNIAYLQETHPKLFANLSALENAIENSNYEEKYELTYENTGFDIYIKESKSFFYRQNPSSYLTATLKSINFKKDENSFIAFKPEEYWNKKTSSNKMKNFEKFVFFGVGTGEHISKFTEKFSASHYLIVEDDLELFRLSLMSTPYYEIAKNSHIFFAIFQEKEEYEKTINSFLSINYHLNNYIKFLQLPYFEETKITLFHLSVTTQSHLNFSYESILSQYTLALKRIQENYNFLNILEEQKNSSLQNTSIVLIAPGPSLVKNILWLQESKKKFCIVALSATLPILQKYHIVPDIVTHIDGFERSLAHFERLNNPHDYLKNSIALISARAPKKLFQYFSSKKLFLFENGTEYKKDFGSFSAFCAGSSSYLLFIAMRVKSIYLLGLDLALDAKTFESHSEGYLYTKKADNSTDTLRFRDSILYTEGNFSTEVPTTPNFLLSIKAINEITLALKNNEQNVYNLSIGAKLKEIEPLRVQKIILTQLQDIDKKQLQQTILDSFTKHSQDRLTDIEFKNLQTSISLAKEYKKKILAFEKEDKGEEFFTSLLKLSKKLTEEKHSQVIALILEHYFKTKLPYITDILNSLDEKLYEKEISTLLVQELLSIVDRYIKDIDARY